MYYPQTLIMRYFSPISIPPTVSENPKLGAGERKHAGTLENLESEKVLWFWGSKLGHGTQLEGYHPFLSGAPGGGSDDSHLRC